MLIIGCDFHLHQRIRNAGIDILPNFKKGGVAGAYNRGLERLIERMCKILFIFDQDSAVPDDYFTKMLDACLALDSPRFLVGPKIFDVNVARDFMQTDVMVVGILLYAILGKLADLLAKRLERYCLLASGVSNGTIED